MGSLDPIVETLASFSIHAGFPAERSALAGILLSNGFGPEDVELIAQHCEDTVRLGSPAAVAASLLRDPEKLRPKLDDLRACAMARSRRVGRVDPYFGESQWKRPTLYSESPEDWLARSFAVRVDREAAAIETVAAQAGVSLDRATTLLARGRAIRADPATS